MRDAATDVNSTRSLSGRARARRWQQLIKSFPSLSEMRVLDLGGTPESWRLAPVRPKSVTTVNLLPAESDQPDLSPSRETPAIFRAPLPVTTLTWCSPIRCSSTWVAMCNANDWLTTSTRSPTNIGCTPYRYLPIEPHWLFPGIQWLPYAARVQVSIHWNRGHIRTHTREEVQQQVDEVELIGISQMRRYFPSSVIWYERFAGLIKSLVAIRNDVSQVNEPDQF
ncbi:MAG: class I SAM-dependent methyltransferase [Mycobacterium sp.]